MGTANHLKLLLLSAALAVNGLAFTGTGLLAAAHEAEARHDSERALALYLQASAADPGNAWLLQKIARQYSDLVLEQPTVARKRAYAEQARRTIPSMSSRSQSVTASWRSTATRRTR
jgi:hypothetical protein